MTAISESYIKTEIKKLLYKHSVYWLMPQTGLYGRRGVPDFIGCHDGVFFAVEAKASNRQHNVSAMQKLIAEQIKKANGVYFLVHDHHSLDAFDAWLDESDETKNENN